MTPRTCTAALCCALILLGAGAARSASYNFTVPVDLKDLPPEIKQVEVSCSVRAGAVALATSSARRPVSAGRLSGDVEVGVSTNPSDKRVPTQWSCAMNLIGQTAGKDNKYVPSGGPKGARFNPDLPAKAGEPVLLQVEGALK